MTCLRDVYELSTGHIFLFDENDSFLMRNYGDDIGDCPVLCMWCGSDHSMYSGMCIKIDTSGVCRL